MSLLYGYQGRNFTRDFVINTGSGGITPDANDKVRVRIMRLGGSPVLEISSDEDTANGSSLTKGYNNRLRIDAADMAAIIPGTYTLAVDYFDYDDAEEWKHVDRQVLHIEEGEA